MAEHQENSQTIRVIAGSSVKTTEVGEVDLSLVAGRRLEAHLEGRHGGGRRSRSKSVTAV